jgi:protein MAK11
MALIHTITHPARQHDVRFCKRVVGEGEVLLIAAEDKKVSVYTVPKDRNTIPTVIAELVGHSNRLDPYLFILLQMSRLTKSASKPLTLFPSPSHCWCNLI